MEENKLRAFRESLGITQQEMADDLGVTRVAISNYELGRREPNGAFFAKLKGTYKLTDKVIGGMLLDYAEKKSNNTAD